MKFREITGSDLSALPGLLSEGFPSTRPAFWSNALDVLSKRAPVDGMPRYGIVLDVDGLLGGVMLMLSHRRGDTTYCNLSSWYVRDPHRGMSSFMLGHSLRAKDVTFLDCSPTPPVVPMIEKLGFTSYSGGSLLIDLRAGLRPGPGVARLTAERLADCGHPDQDRIAENLAFGCRGLIARDPDGAPVPLVYRVSRVKRHVPIARFVLGAPETITAHAGAIARHLLARGVPLALVDWPPEAVAPLGRTMPGYGVRYRCGGPAPALGDLLDTEYALFGI